MKKSIIFCFLILVLISTFVSASERDTYFENIKFGMNMNKVIESIDLEVEEIKQLEQNGILLTTLIDIPSGEGAYGFTFVDNKLLSITRYFGSDEKEVLKNYRQSWEKDVRNLINKNNFVHESKVTEKGVDFLELNSLNYNIIISEVINSDKVINSKKINMPDNIEIPKGMNYIIMDTIISREISIEIQESIK